MGTEIRKAVPVEVWQSVQWQIATFSGSASPSMAMKPQWQAPSTFMKSLLDLFGGLLDRRHVGVAQAEMMADLVNEHMLDDIAQRVLVLGPVIEDRPAVEPDHVRHLPGGAFRAERQADPLEQAEQVELALRLHLVKHLVAWKI